jgi:hypothetical protein
LVTLPFHQVRSLRSEYLDPQKRDCPNINRKTQAVSEFPECNAPAEPGLSQITQPNEQRLWGETRIFWGENSLF